jgi:hypothetical protein
MTADEPVVARTAIEHRCRAAIRDVIEKARPFPVEVSAAFFSGVVSPMLSG